MNTAKASDQPLESRPTSVDLDRRYGQIGISALVAALAYRSETKNAAYAPVEARD